MHAENAANGSEALALLRGAVAQGRSFDVAIVDMQMPGMDGMGLANAINADPALVLMPLVLLTSFGDRGEAKMAQESGFAAYLTKPLRQHHLYQCLRRVMGKPEDREA